MRTGANPNIWLVICCISLEVLGSTNTTLAQEPLYFADAALKASVEAELGVSDPTPTDMLGLTSLACTDSGIVDLTGLEYATNLTDLDLADNQIGDISALSGLTNLQVLRLGHNRIGDISVVAGLTNLQVLCLQYNQISDISAVAGLTDLTELWVNNNRISDISVVAGLTNLQVLWLGYNQISDVSAVAGLTNLTKLALYNDKISDISPLSGLTNLRDLLLECNQISDIWPLSGLTNLKQLRLYHNQISDISVVAGLTNLESLWLSDNQISDISAVAGLTNLLYLDLTRNQISDISALAGLTNMMNLYLHENLISDISALAGLTNLARLGLYDNQISDISALREMGKLLWLGLDNNQVSDISALSAMKNLMQLDLRGNPLNEDAYDIYIPLIIANHVNITLQYDERPVLHTLTISSTGGGSVSVPGEGEFVYEHGLSVPIAASADVGYVFVNWTGTAADAGKIADPGATDTSVIVDANYAIQANFEVTPTIIYVDHITGDDNNDGWSSETAFATVQRGIDAARDGDTVLVYPGVYAERIFFMGKAITVQSAEDAAILEGLGEFAVSFYKGEGPDTILRNFVIRGCIVGVCVVDSSPTISNVTVVDNEFGIAAYKGAEPNITNSIFWNNSNSDLFECQARYSWVQRDVSPVLMDGLVSYWPFDETGDNIAHDVAGGQDGVVHGAQWVHGVVGGALQFDGVDDYVELPANEPVWLPREDFTLSVWIYFERDSVSSSSENEVIIDLNFGDSSDPANELGCMINRRSGSAQLCFKITTTTNSDEDLCSNEILAANTWHHIVAVREGTSQTIYLNGRLDKSRTCSADPIDFVGGYDDNKVNVGRYTTTIGQPRYYLQGGIDDVRIYDRALSAEEIQQLYQIGLDGSGFGTNPLFADPANGDYHLLSERGRYWPEHDVWVLDKVTSPCIDGGDPNADYSNEPTPNGGRINMGAYGGTPYASMSETQWFDPDVNQDGIIDLTDLIALMEDWLELTGWFL